MRILTFSTLYPSAALPAHGIFVETRLRHLLAGGGVESKVVAPVPWFPLRGPRFGRYAAFAAAPHEEQRHGIDVLHPRYVTIPRIGMSVAPFLLASGAHAAVQGLARSGYDFDLIDAHYLYPDGVAAVLLGKRLAKPVVITARGTDVNLLPRYRLPRRMILWATRHAAAIVTVARALKDRLVELGVPAERIEVLRNGVDARQFQPVDRELWRRQLGFTRTTLLSVGNLLPLKRHDLTIRALRLMPEVDLVIAGDGPERAALGALARDTGVHDRVRFTGALPQEELVHYYGAADALVLVSSREGWANVLLESMACGTPVVASSVGGTPEVVNAPEAGVLLTEGTPEALAAAVRRLLAACPDRAATRRHAEEFSWDATTAGQLGIFRRILAN